MGRGRSRRIGEAEGLHDGVVEGRADLGDFVIFARGIDAIGEQYDENLAVWVNPNGSAGEAGVSVTMRRKEVAAGAAFGGHDPAERPGAVGEWLRCGELSNGGALEDALVSVNAAVEEHLAKRGQVRGRAEHAGVTGNAAHGVGVFVMHLALHEVVAEAGVEFRGSD